MCVCFSFCFISRLYKILVRGGREDNVAGCLLQFFVFGKEGKIEECFFFLSAIVYFDPTGDANEGESKREETTSTTTQHAHARAHDYPAVSIITIDRGPV